MRFKVGDPVFCHTSAGWYAGFINEVHDGWYMVEPTDFIGWLSGRDEDLHRAVMSFVGPIDMGPTLVVVEHQVTDFEAMCVAQVSRRCT